jgi:Zn-finger nucleic acid-binding protein
VEVTGGGGARIDVCVRCFWVWLDAEQVDSLATLSLEPRYLR